MRLVPFTDELLPQAAAILAARHRREVEIFPELPARFGEAPRAQTALEAEWSRAGAGGVALLDEAGRLVGFMVGHRLVDSFWGRSAWVRYPGMGLAPELSAEWYRRLYAELAGPWVEQGYFRHYVFVPAGDPALVDAWLRLGFAYQQAYALMDLEAREERPVAPPEGVHIRRAGPADAPALRALAGWIRGHLAQSPGWCPIFPEELEELREGYARMVDDPEASLWVAVRGQEIVGLHAYWPAAASETDMILPDRCVELKVAVTRPGERRKGIDSALFTHCMGELRARGYRFCATDWYILNLLASVHWPKRGFRTVTYRLARQVDERVAWARGTGEG